MQTPRDFARENFNPLQVYARTVWAEARGESREGQRAVAWVIRNRAENPRWWGRDIKDVCLKDWQFSCWNVNDPQSQRLLKDLESTALYESIEDLCIQVLAEPKYMDPTGNSDHYLTTAIMHSTSWSKGRVPERIIGNHAFYRLELPPEAPQRPVPPVPRPKPIDTPQPPEIEPQEAPKGFWRSVLDRLFKRPS